MNFSQAELESFTEILQFYRILQKSTRLSLNPTMQYCEACSYDKFAHNTGNDKDQRLC